MKALVIVVGMMVIGMFLFGNTVELGCNLKNRKASIDAVN